VTLQVEEGTESLEQLADRAQAGCLVSFEKIVEQCKDRLFTYLIQLVGNSQDAEDVAQETFIKAYRHLHSFDGRARFTTWLYAIAKNTAFTHLRRRKPNQPIDELEEILPAPEERIDSDQIDSVWTVARTLKPNLFEVLWLFYGEGFSLKEIAKISGGNAVTVRVNLHRARAALAKKCNLEKFQ
jgi:RNA polymerase sigma-70 factor (ECF subfamily)